MLDELKELNISEILVPKVPDRIAISTEATAELANSIREVGLLSPILVARINGQYEIAAGHRRFLAVSSLGHATITAFVRDSTPEEVSILRAIENLQRENLTPYEECLAYERLRKEHDLSFAEVAKRTGRTEAVVRRRIAILSWDDKTQKACHEKKISVSVGEELVRCKDIGYREYLLEMAIDHGITRDIAKMWVEDWQKSQRRANNDKSPGGGEMEAGLDVPIYTACDLCQTPVNINDIKTVRMCKGCHKALVAEIQEANKH